MVDLTTNALLTFIDTCTKLHFAFQNIEDNNEECQEISAMFDKIHQDLKISISMETTVQETLKTELNSLVTCVEISLKLIDTRNNEWKLIEPHFQIEVTKKN